MIGKNSILSLIVALPLLAGCDRFCEEAKRVGIEIKETKEGVFYVDHKSNSLYLISRGELSEVGKINLSQLQLKNLSHPAPAYQDVGLTIQLKFNDGEMQYIAEFRPKRVEKSGGNFEIFNAEWAKIFDSKRPASERKIERLTLHFVDKDGFGVSDVALNLTEAFTRIASVTDETSGYRFNGRTSVTARRSAQINDVQVTWREY